MFSSTDKVITKFMALSALSTRNCSGMACVLQFTKSNPILFLKAKSFIAESWYLSSFCECKKAVCEDFIFKALGSGSIFSAIGKQVIADTESLRLLQMKETHGKLYASDEDGLCDLSWWRKAAFEEVCFKSDIQNNRRKYLHDEIGSLLVYKEQSLLISNFKSLKWMMVTRQGVYR